MLSSSREATLFTPDPAAYLPHRNPFLFIDRVLAREPGCAATGMLAVSADTSGFPSILLLEAMAQLAGIAAGQEEGGEGILAAIDRAELPVSVPPGATVLVTARVVKSFGALFLVEGEARIGEEAVARATLTVAVGSLR